MVKYTLNKLFLLLLITSLSARNKVITKDFKWKIYPTENFDIYYYEGEKILPKVAEYLEYAHKKVTTSLNIKMTERIPFFLYIGQNDFEQTNISDVGEGTGAFAEVFKYRFVVPFNGSFTYLKHLILHEFTHIAQFHILYGYGFAKSFKLMKFPFYPLWLIEGMAEYFGTEEDYVDREVYLRDITYNKNYIPLRELHSFSHLQPNEGWKAYKQSEAFIHFIADEYGEEKIEEMMQTFTRAWDSDSVLIKTIGANMAELDKKFQEYLEDVYMPKVETKEPPIKFAKQITKNLKFPYQNTDPAISPDGKYIAYLSNKSGFTELLLHNIEKNKTVTLISRQHFGEVEHISSGDFVGKSVKSLSFSHDSNLIIFVGEKNQRDYIYIYDLQTKKLRKINPGVEILYTPSISPDNKKIVFSALKNSQTDIYIYDLQTKELKNLTNDGHDDLEPSFSPDGKKIVYTKELPTKNSKKSYEYDLFIFDLEQSTNERLTSISGDELNPIFYGSDAVLFVSDTDSFPDIHIINLTTKEIKRLTNSITNAVEPSISNNGDIAFMSLWNSSKHIYLTNIKNLIPRDVTVATAELRDVEERKLEKEPQKYKFRYTTDVLIPWLLYHTNYGLSAALHWQSSDYLGNNKFMLSLAYLERPRFLEYQAIYEYSRFTPYLTLAFSGQQRMRWESHIQRATLTFPLNRFDRLETSAINSITTWMLGGKETINLLAYSLIRETLSGEYIEPLSGERIWATIAVASNFWGGSAECQLFLLECLKYHPIGTGKSIVARFLSLNSFGRKIPADWLFSLGGRHAVRGYPYHKKERHILISNIEFKFPIARNINYHMWYMLPDLFLKSFYCSIFYDIGTNYKTVEHSTGVNFRLFAFVLQQFPINFDLVLAYDFKGRVIATYFIIGYFFW